ncbi:MAG TPA: hypothetical protein VFM14_01145 [Gemmatimonadales bacterium]|nr:hypothetical protein [Gemmatimonadales bacterium]
MSAAIQWGGAIAIAIALAGCQERLTQPGECPALCPGGTPEVIEEVLEAAPLLDSTFTGYAERGSAQVLLVSSGVPTAADTNFAVLVFQPRPDSTRLRDTLRSYTVDSIRLGIGLIARDSAVKNLRFELYRLPATLDTTALSYDGIRPLFGSVAAVILVHDTATRGAQTVMLRGAEVAPFALALEDAGRLRLGVRVVGDNPTGARIGQRTSAVPATFGTFITPVAENTVTQELDLGLEFDTYVSRLNPVPGPDLLAAGGVPASRSLIRFSLPPRIRDSASVVRATLELVTTEAVRGLPNDPGTLEIRTLTTDLGAKSPTNPQSLSTRSLPAGTSGTVSAEVGPLVRLWQGSSGRPSTLMLQMSPEAGTFTEASFGSTRLGTPARVRIEYMRAFPFERP